MDKIDNSQGKVFYGMHFYPGVARYETPESHFTVFLNEQTIRKMGPTFEGRPVFLEHAEVVNEDVNELRKEADGWVVESFFNEADGKHWVKMIVVTDKALRAIKQNYRLSNAYIPKSFGPKGMWNGVDYEREVTDAEYEHLAIVSNPRYEESVIMTPEEFKSYNEKCKGELKRLSNSNEKEKKMGFKLFKRQKVENSADFEGMVVELPKSKKEMTISSVIEEYDKIVNMNGYANGDHMVKVGENEEMSVNDLVKAHIAAKNEMEEMKKKKDGEEMENADDQEMDDPAVDNDSQKEIEAAGMEDVGDRGGDKHLHNEDDEEDDKEKDKKKNKKMSNELSVEEAKAALAKAEARAKARRLKNARENYREEEAPKVELIRDQVARGQARYGSGR